MEASLRTMRNSGLIDRSVKFGNAWMPMVVFPFQLLNIVGRRRCVSAVMYNFGSAMSVLRPKRYQGCSELGMSSGRPGAFPATIVTPVSWRRVRGVDERLGL